MKEVAIIALIVTVALFATVSADQFGYGQQSITPQITVIQTVNNTINNTFYISNGTAASVALVNVTGVSSTACSGTDKVKNVTFINGVFYIVCGTDNTGGGMDYAYVNLNIGTNLTVAEQYANTILQNNISFNNGSWTSTYNATYDGYPATWNNSINQIIQFGNASWSSTSNSSYQLTSTLNTTINQQFQLAGNNNTWSSTFNTTYDTWAYNQTNPAVATCFAAANANYTNLTLYVNSKAGGSMDYPYVNNNIVANATNLTTYVNNVNTTIYTYLANAYMTLMLNMLQGNLTAERVTTNSSINNIIQLGNASWSSTSNSSYQLTSTLNTTINQQFQLAGNNNTWSSTYNSSYDSGIKWQYNQSTFPLTNASSTYVPYIGTSTNINIGAHNLTFSQGSNLSSGGSSIWNNGSGWCFGSC